MGGSGGRAGVSYVFGRGEAGEKECINGWSMVEGACIDIILQRTPSQLVLGRSVRVLVDIIAKPDNVNNL